MCIFYIYSCLYNVCYLHLEYLLHFITLWIFLHKLGIKDNILIEVHPCHFNEVLLAIECMFFYIMHNCFVKKYVVLLPIKTLYRYSAGAVTFLYYLATRLFMSTECQECTCQIQI